MTTNPTPDRPVNDMRELYAVQHAITDAGGTLAPEVHKAIDELREAWDRELRRAQAEAYQYRTALQGAARNTVVAVAAPPTGQTAPTVWIDGHPQLEAIAAAVWERCRTEDTSTVVDDPRNIAVAAYAAILATADTSQDRCAECSHPRGAHEEAEEPVSVGRCTVCADQDDEDAEWHDFEAAEAQQQPETQAAPDVVAAIVDALQARAGELQELAEEQMRPSLEERAQEWHAAAEVARRAAKAAASPARKPQPFTPPAHYRGRDGTAYCVHATPVGPDSCRHCRELADDQPAASAGVQTDEETSNG